MPHSLVANDDTYLMYNDSFSNKSHQHQQQQQQQQQSNNNNRIGKSSSENLKYIHKTYLYIIYLDNNNLFCYFEKKK